VAVANTPGSEKSNCSEGSLAEDPVEREVLVALKGLRVL
jgi:hypothetical protein